jgi:hypothetical protein
MALENADVVDAIGTETATGIVVLTIIDAWDWTEERTHLLALQTKLNTYFEFVSTGQLVEDYPQAAGRPLRLDVIARFSPPRAAEKFFETVATFARENFDLMFRHTVQLDRP